MVDNQNVLGIAETIATRLKIKRRYIVDLSKVDYQLKNKINH